MRAHERHKRRPQHTAVIRENCRRARPAGPGGRGDDDTSAVEKIPKSLLVVRRVDCDLQSEVGVDVTSWREDA